MLAAFSTDALTGHSIIVTHDGYMNWTGNCQLVPTCSSLPMSIR
jgi:hypothetical protein